jgi:hypothetical protein
LNGGKPGEQELWNELQLLKKELRSKEEQERQKQEEFKVYQQQQQIEQHIQSYVQESDKVVEDEELSSKFPNLAITPPIRRRAMVQHAVRWCISNSPDTTFQAILEHLDNTLEKEYSELDQLRSRVMGAQKKTPEAQGAGKPAAKRKKKTISNVDEAAPSVNFVPISQDERIAAAAKELPDFSVGLKNS